MSVALHSFPTKQLEYGNSPTVAEGAADMETDAPQAGDEMMVDGEANMDDEVQMISGDEDINIDDGGDEGHGSFVEDLDLDIDEGTADDHHSTNNDTSHEADIDLEADDVHDDTESHTINAENEASGSQDEHEFHLEEDGDNATSVVASQEQSGLHQVNNVEIRSASSPQGDTEIHTEAVNHKDDDNGRRHSNSIDLSSEGADGPKNVHVKTEQKDGHNGDKGAQAEINDIKACKDEDTGKVVIKTKQETPDGEEDVQTHVVQPGEDLDTEHVTHSKSGAVHSSSVHIHVDSGNQNASKHTSKPGPQLSTIGDEDAKQQQSHNSGHETQQLHEGNNDDEDNDDEDGDQDADYDDENEEPDGSEDDDDESYDEPEDVPPTKLLFKESTFVLFTQTDGKEPLFSDAHRLFAEPLENFITAVKSEFVGPDIQDEETVLNFASLQLTITEDNFYAKQVALQDIYRLFVAAVEDGSIEETVFSIEMSLQPRFISRFNELAMKIKESEQNINGHQDGDDSVLYADAHDTDAAEEQEGESTIVADEGNETIYEDAVEQPHDDFAAFDNADEDGVQPVTTTEQHEGEQLHDSIQQEEVEKEVTAGDGKEILPVDLTEGDEYDYLAEANDEANTPGGDAKEAMEDHENDDDAPVTFANGKKRSNGDVDALETELETYDSPAPEHASKRVKSE